jgi:non-ribosomal peptide synthetase component F
MNLSASAAPSLFCGEALPVEIVRHWALAAPNSVIENIYGPTELTIGCTAYRWSDTRSSGQCDQGVVPIGQPFDAMRALIVDEQLREVEPGREGELLMAGPQLSLGYWQDGERTRRAFVFRCKAAIRIGRSRRAGRGL